MKQKITKQEKKPNKIVEAECIDYTFDGQGLCMYDKHKRVFVPSILIGERAEIEILFNRKDFSVGKIKKFITMSKDRVLPKCGIATACGGCCFQNLDYKKQLEYKKKFAYETLKRIGKFNPVIDDIYGMDDPYYYRNKIQVPFGYDKQHRLVYGFYKFKTHDIVPTTECVIEDKKHINILKSIKETMLEIGIEPYNEDTRKGILRHALIRVAKYTDDVMLVLIVNEESFKGKKDFFDKIIEKCPEITTIVLNENTQKTNVILGDKDIVVFGDGYITDSLLGVKFRISARSFYQTNPTQTELLYSLALKYADIKKTDKVLDAYCGIGTIGLIASKKAKSVIGVEVVGSAIKDAKNNAILNNITNAKFVRGKCESYMLDKDFDVIIVDPPRSGLENTFTNQLLKTKAKKIVYISCDVATLARDLNKLKTIYDIKNISLVDMFPHTRHVESCVLLELKK